jgi:cytochrome b6-f complex iron-sulfur subunit
MEVLMARDVRQGGLFYPGSEAAAEAARRGESPNPGGDVGVDLRRGFWSRRTILRFAGWGTLLALLGQWSVGFGAFFWPKKVGAFGGIVSAGNVEDIKVGEVKDFQEAKFFLSHVPEGVLALWKKCPHLGCTVPWKPDDPSMDSVGAKGRFNCPCHGSIYDRYGNIIAGPAPRPMDIFPVEVRDGKVYVNTNPTQAQQRTSDDVRNSVTPV